MRELIKAGISKFEALCAAGLAVAIVGMTPQSALAVDGKQVVSGGGEISFTGASETNWVYNADTSTYDLILKFADPEAADASFSFPGTTVARILAVGGGGGGGGIYRTGGTGNYGGGGGGGGGGVVETNDLFGAATFSVKVGAGGEAAKNTTSGTGTALGETGGATSVEVDDQKLLIAYGGGGGGGLTAGGEGASGGGGSMNKAGDVGAAGAVSAEAKSHGNKGNVGGLGNVGILGGGGGGAGKPGANADAVGGPIGGDGVPNDITGDPNAYYGGGGGGGDSARTPTGQTTGIPGGKGGGGQGGNHRTPGVGGEATDGEPGKGGGGGGAAHNSGASAGNGGCGAVIVRIAASLKGGLEKPVDTSYVYDGSGKISIVPSYFYLVEGTQVATNVGIYTATAKLKSGITWSDGTTGDVTVTMVISAAGTKSGRVEVTGAPVDYFGALKEPEWIDNGDGTKDVLLAFTNAASFTLPGSSMVRILAVGGGGGGGGIYRTGGTGNYGGGGGGGGGGVVETNALFSGATYFLTIGAGGEAAKNTTSSTGTALGETGGATSVEVGDRKLLVAYGGGGGGGLCGGGEGASGGGGSMNKAGDTGAAGAVSAEAKSHGNKGNVGGLGNVGVLGGGGGGAGKPGSNADADGGPTGGDGIENDITGKSGVYYGGGGGGGDSARTPTGQTTGIPGGKGGGGQGGNHRTPGVGGEATDGEPGTGGGGGGAAHNNGSSAGNGGCGIVIIRISSAMIGDFKRPESNPPPIEYDGNAHTSVFTTVFYDVMGQNVGTNVGSYKAIVGLKDGVSWPEGDRNPVTVTMVIEPVKVTVSDFSQADWAYGTKESDIPQPKFAVSPEWVRSKLTWEYGASKTGDEWSTETPSDAGDYWVRLRAPDDGNYAFEPQYAPFKITKVKVTFSDLKLRSWLSGTPVESTPKPSCTVDPDWVWPIYRYAANETATDWSDEKPTEAGTYCVRVGAPDEVNYDFDYQYAEFKVVNGLGEIFTDYVEITIPAYKGTNPDKLTNFPFKVTLSETSPIGFTYERAGLLGGNDLAFTDEEGRNVLPYQVGSWNPGAESTLYVKIPLISNKSQIIRLYWHVRPGALPPEHFPEEVWSDWTDEEYRKITKPPTEQFKSAVVRDGFLVNYWKTEPQMSKTYWDVDDPEPGRIIRNATPAFGKVRRSFTNIVEQVGYDTLPTNIGGSFRVVWELDDPIGEYEPLECHIDYAVSARTPWNDLKGGAENLTLSGRVMLVNDDDVDEAHKVTDQSYWQTREVVTNETTGATMTNAIYWTHEGDSTDFTQNPYVLPNTTHRLNIIGADGKTSLLWRFVNTRLGNPYYSKTTSRFYLPQSSTAKAISSYANYTNETMRGAREEAGNIIFRNMGDEVNIEKCPVVYSPCYTNGIGTIYFDAVNGQLDNLNPTTRKPEEAYRIVVEVATATRNGESPTDKNAYGVNPETGVEEELGLIGPEQWKKCEMIPLMHSGAAGGFVPLAVTNDLQLACTNRNTMTDFYRICVKVNYRQAARFRIRRVSLASGMHPDENAFIQLDNIIVSYPQMTADLEPFGEYDPDRSGKRILGWGGAMAPAFPSLGDRADGKKIIARANAKGYVNAFTNVPAQSVLLRTQMFYRWRYLDQAYDPVDPTAWKVIDLWPGDGMASLDGLDLPDAEGDVEFWYRTDLNVPYYDYFDYTGLGLKLRNLDGTDAYSEEIHEVYHSLRQGEYESLPSSGTNWFFRVRAGSSEYEGLRVITRKPDGSVATNEMELVGNGLWRGCVPTYDELADGLEYRFEGVNRQPTGSTSYARGLTFWAATETANALPIDVPVATAGADKWAKVVCDARTGYLLFRLDEAKQSVYVAHADYQDFNLWSSAVNTNGLFVGNSTDTNSTSDVAKEIPSQSFTWPTSSSTNENWTEDFDVGTTRVARVVYPRNEPFAEGRSERGWTVENGMWTYGKWSIETDKGFGDETALQLEGCGRGRMSYINATDIPLGIDKITFTARVAQFNGFNDFTYFNGYTLVKNPPTSESDFIPAIGMKESTFATLAALTERGEESFQGDGSLSLVANYHPQNGAYEFRVSRGTNKDALRLTLYRWSVNGRTMECEELGHKDFNNKNLLQANMLVKEWSASATVGYLGGLYITVGPYSKGNGVVVKAGVLSSADGVDSSANRGSSLSKKNFVSISYIDTSDRRVESGTFGVLARNCPGVFVKPSYYTQRAKLTEPTKANELTADTAATMVEFLGTAKDGAADDAYYTNWMIRQERMEKVGKEHSQAWGFLGVKDVEQKVIVQMSEHGANKWVTISTNTVTGFNDIVYTNTVRSAKPSDVRLQVAGSASDDRRDVTIRRVALTQWVGESTPGYDDSSAWGFPNDYVYTSAWVLPSEANTSNKVLRLQPTRAADEATAVSLRTPIMNGFGLIHFDWRNADSRGKLLVQIAEGATRNNLITTTKASSDNQAWETLETLDFSKVGASGTHTVYVNRRYPKTGVLRLVVARDVVTAALAENRPRTDVDYGLVEIFNVFTWDLPQYDNRSWTGWNFRAEGWDGTNPGPFANLNDGTHGISGLLNNTLDKSTLVKDDPTAYQDRLPSVQTPTFGTNCIGAVDFRARLYDRDDLAKAGYPAVLTLYGARQKDIFGEPSDWVEVDSIVISNGFYRTFTKKFRPTDNFYSLRLAVKGVKGVTGGGKPVYDPPLRVAIDDVCVYERPKLLLQFNRFRVRPFRNADSLRGRSVVRDIDSVNEQPLAGEAFGFQAELEVKSDDEILVNDPEHPVTVELWFYPKAEPWGFDNWRTAPGAVRVDLSTAEGEKLVFRSMISNPDSLCQPQFPDEKLGYGIVQYHFIAHYYDTGLEYYEHQLSNEDWSMPSWNLGFDDPNAKPGAAFSAFTLLESIAPKRAWINEINYSGPSAALANVDQWVEIAVPSGVSMKNWQLRLYDRTYAHVANLMTFGQNCPDAKNVSGDPSHYDFYLVKSPQTKTLRDGSGTAVEADATWPAFSTNNIAEGVLNYTHPFGFELVRPTGVVEHRVVAQGWNQYRDAGYWYDYLYDGTNMVKELDAATGGGWTWGGEDYYTNTVWTVGVVTNQGGDHAEWASPMDRTPGARNAGQTIDPEWYVHPNGGYFWVYSTVLGEHMRQIVAGETNLVTSLTVQEGTPTNILYEVDQWYQLGELNITPNRGTRLTGPTVERGKRYYSLQFDSVSNRYDVTVRAKIDDDLEKRLGPDNSYTPAIMKWLERGRHGGPDGTDVPFKGGALTNVFYRGTDGTTRDKIDLTGMYWLDLDPTDGDWELWGGMGEPGGRQALGPVNCATNRVRSEAGGVEYWHTNRLTTVWLMLTNAATHEAYAPYRMQGHGNEQSDTYPGVWTSANFKVTMQLIDGVSTNRPMRYFVFGSNSFRKANDALAPFCSRVEIVDPFSRQSPAWEWGWWKYPDKVPGTGWKIDNQVTPGGVSTLRYEDFLEF